MTVCTISTAYYFITHKTRLQQNNRKEFKKESQSIIVMCAMDIFYLACNLPFCMQQLIHDSFIINNISFYNWTFIYDFTNILTNVQSSCSFFIYFFCNKHFRKYFLQMIAFQPKGSVSPLITDNQSH